MRPFEEFCIQFGIPAIDLNKIIDSGNVEEVSNHFYLVTEEQKKMVLDKKKKVFSAGMFIGKKERDGFKPSFYLLERISRMTKQKIILTQKAEWLFCCGRDIFLEGVKEGLGKTGETVIVVNNNNECLGYAEIVDKRIVYAKNKLDLGDFLRREREGGERAVNGREPSKEKFE